MAKKAVFFDLDGTLLDTLEDLCDAVNLTMRKFGSPERTLSEVRSFLGNGAADLIAKSIEGGRENENYERALAFFKEYYGAHADIKTHPYDGVVELLERLRDRGIICAVVTNKPDAAAKTLCQKHFGALLASVIGDREGLLRKPARDKIDAMAAELGADRLIFVGDSEVDVLTAKNAEIPCVCLTWGFRDRDVLEASGCELFADNADELDALITEIFSDGEDK